MTSAFTMRRSVVLPLPLRPRTAVVVPGAALLPAADGGTQVMVVGVDAAAHARKIETGVRDGELVEVVKGLKPGEQVVTVGGLGLQDGAKVRVEKEPS